MDDGAAIDRTLAMLDLALDEARFYGNETMESDIITAKQTIVDIAILLGIED